MSTPAKEKRFLDALESLFTGAEVEGDSGFVNLMRMKRAHFHSIKPKLMKEIKKRADPQTAFREELFDKLYTFFSRYFCESGSIYFRHLPAFSKTYERVYADGQDVALSWKTKMLYYVKSDVLVRSMPVELNEEGQPQQTRRFYFDASECEHKKNNERRDFVFTFDEVKRGKEGKVVCLKVSYSTRGSKTNVDEIIKEVRKKDISLTEDQLQKSISVFQRQTEADFFINKDARGFLREQFDLWMYQYMFQEETVFDKNRIKQIQTIKDIAYNIIDFIAQFEDELRRVWEKPKFVRNVNYVVTLDKLAEGILQKIAKHTGAKAQIKEWRELGLVENGFSMKKIFTGRKGQGGECQFLPLDTKYFKDLELEILDGLGNLDEALDGELVHSENWQALNSLYGKYAGKVKCIYIDPPFNLDDSDQFDYRTNYKDACWVTMLENRIGAGKGFLSEDGGIFVRCGHDGNHLVRLLLNHVFGEINYRNEIVIRRAQEQKGEMMKQFSDMKSMMVNYDNIYWFSVNPKTRFNFVLKKANKEQTMGHWMNLWKVSNRPKLRYEILGVDLNKFGKGQWMWGKDRSLRAVKNHNAYLSEQRKTGISLIEYWKKNHKNFHKQTNKKLEFVRKEPSGKRTGIWAIQYWVAPREFVISDNNWMDLRGYSSTTGFNTENSEVLLERIVSHLCPKGEIILDFFSGSGTTQVVAQKLGRKWLGIEMGNHFHTVILPRVKNVLAGHKTGISNKISYKGGGFFKYYSLEQYEEALKNSHYQGGKQLELDTAKSPFQQYAFFADDKLTHVIKPKTAALNINLHDLYSDIDIPESLANILGKQIRKRTADMVTFEDGSTEKIDPKTMTEKQKRDFISLIKPYLWWDE